MEQLILLIKWFTKQLNKLLMRLSMKQMVQLVLQLV
uniref:Uncharacterized protein n=1 Tax=Picea glauca TaxID=3330 RepID=A0A101M053_PICGL|nr:hypothetical protein ABT39_MTgene4537 [Picea glauca]